MSILLNVVGYENAPWREVLSRELPSFDVLKPHEVDDASCIEYAAVWQHPHNDLHRYPNLKAILNLGAGTDHIDRDPSLQKMASAEGEADVLPANFSQKTADFAPSQTPAAAIPGSVKTSFHLGDQ